MTTQLTTISLDDLQAVTGGDLGGNHDGPSSCSAPPPPPQPTPKPVDQLLPVAPSPTLPSGHYLGHTAI